MIEKTSEHERRIDLSKGFPNFLIKLISICISVVLVIGLLVPNFPETQRNKLVLLGLIQNPYVLLELSQMEEERGRLDKAVLYTSAAIGLLEMHGASEKVINRYQQRVKHLKSLRNTGK